MHGKSLRKGARMNEIYGFAAIMVSIFAAQLFSNRQLNERLGRVEKELKGTRLELISRVDRVQIDLVSRMDRVQDDLSSRIDRVQSDLSSRIDRVQGDLSQFAHELGGHDARLDLLEQKAI
jgi:hypothetical protein